MCWLLIWKSQGGGFSWRPCPMLYPKPCPSWLNAPTLISGVWISGLRFPCAALGFPSSLGFLPKTQGGVWGFGPGVSLLYSLLDLTELITPSGLHAGLCPSLIEVPWLWCQLSPPSRFSPRPLPDHDLFHNLQMSPFPTSPPQDSWTIFRQTKAEDGGSRGFLLSLPMDLKIKNKGPL